MAWFALGRILFVVVVAYARGDHRDEVEEDNTDQEQDDDQFRQPTQDDAAAVAARAVHVSSLPSDVGGGGRVLEPDG